MFATMKKMYRFLFAVAAAATALVGCVREPEMLPAAEEHPIHFVAESIETRTAFGDPTGNTYPTLWTANDQKVMVSLDMKQTQNATVTPSADFKTATFTANFADTTVWRFFAVSPSSAVLNVSDEHNYRLGITVPTTQTPTATSVDEAAQILIAESATTTGPTPPESVSFDFHHWTSYGKMSLTNLNLNGAVIESVDLTSEVNWAYRWYYYFADGTTVVNSGAQTITVNTSSAADIWFACAPVDMTGKKLTVTVKTDKGTFTKTVTMPGAFESGKIYRFSVSMAGVPLDEPKVYQKVTNVSALTLDSQVIIAAASDATQYAIASVQSSNNRPGAVVVKTEDKIVDPGDAVAIFKVEAGASEGTFAFKALNGESTAQGYIYASGGTSSNQLKTKNKVDASASWTVTIGEKTVMKAGITGDNARNILQYNPNSGSPIFNCYGGNDTKRDSVAIYKLISGDPFVVKKDPQLRITTLNLNLNIGGQGDASVESTAEGYDGDITYASTNTAVATVDEDGIVTGVATGNCKIIVTASETAQYFSATKECDVVVTDPSAAQTIAQILDEIPAGSLNNGTNTVIKDFVSLGRVTVLIANSGNIIVKDETGLMLIYKPGVTVEPGDVITVTGALKNYFGIAEITFVQNGTDCVITPVSSGAPVEYGTPVTFDAPAINAYQEGTRSVKFIKFTGNLPTSKSSAYVNVGTQKVRIYNTDKLEDDDLGKMATVYAFAYGYHSSGYLQVLVTSYDADASSPFLTVDVTSKTWAADETDACTVNVSVETGGNWTFASTNMDWANVSKSGNTLVVSPKSANTSSSANEGSVVLSNSADASKTATIEFKQSGVVTGSSYVLDSDAIKAAHTSKWGYDSGSKTITAADGSQWICNNTYGVTDQVTVQMNKGKGSYIQTPSVPSGKKITHLVVSCAWNADGTGGFETTRTFDVKDGTTTVLSAVTGKSLSAGVDIPGDHTQLRISPNESTGGASYILNATVTFN